MTKNTRLFGGLILCMACAAGIAFYVARSEPVSQLVRYPQVIDQKCNFGRAKLYDECGSQQAIFDAALQAANAQGKTLLVSYGAEWCIWCHVFDQHLLGSHTTMEYRYAEPGEKVYAPVTLYERAKADPAGEALELKRYAEEHLVVVHIEDRFSPDGFSVLEQTGAAAHFSGGLPFIFSVDQGGAFAGALRADLAETRRDTEDWYRGYNRGALVGELETVVNAAR